MGGGLLGIRMNVEIYEKPLLRFGLYELDSDSGELRKGGLQIKLQPRPFRLLVLLARRAGEVVTREEIKQAIWEPGTFVDFEQGLNSSIRYIRAALNDDPDAPRYIETIPRRGYRFIAPVEGRPREQSAAPGLPAEEMASPRPRRGGRFVAFALAAGLTAVVAAAAWLGISHWRAPAPPPSGRILLVILPFKNLSGDPGQQYLSDGLTEEMITQVGRMSPRRLGVIARTSAMRYAGTKQSAREIGRELGVQYLLEGSVRREGPRVRINAKLIRAADQSQLWGEAFEGDFANLLAIQNDVARSIARSLALELLPGRREAVARASTSSSEAYDAYLQGLFAWNQRTSAGLADGVRFFELAIEKDPDFALAHASLAQALMTLADYRMVRTREVAPRVNASLDRALSIDPLLPEAHASKAIAQAFFDWEFAAAEKNIQRALEINPSYATARHWYSYYLRAMGRFDEAIAESQRALQIDPHSAVIRYGLAMHHYYRRDFDSAMREAGVILQRDPSFYTAWLVIGVSLELKGDLPGAIEALERSASLADGPSPWVLGALGHCYARAGQTARAREILRRLTQSPDRPVQFDAAVVLLGLGDTGGALTELERAAADRASTLRNLNIDPRFDPLRQHPRFLAVLKKVGLP